MSVNTLNLTAVRGVLWDTVIPFLRFDPTDPATDLTLRRRIPLTASEISEIAAAYPLVQFIGRGVTSPDGYGTAAILSLSSASGEITISPSLLGLHLTVPATKMTGFLTQAFDLRFVNPRPGNPAGPDVFYWATGTLTLTPLGTS